MKQNHFEKPATFPPQRAKPRDPCLSSSDLATGAPVFAANLQFVRSEPPLRHFIEGLEMAIIVLDSGIIVEANNQVPAFFGRSVGALLGLHVKELVTNESLTRLAHFLDLDAPKPVFVLGLCQDQPSFPLQLRAVAAIIGDGHRLRVTSLTRCGAN